MTGLAMLLGIGLIWGLAFTLVKIVIGAGADPAALAFWQTALGAVALLLLGRRPRLDAAHLKFYAISGMLGSALPAWLVAMAAQSLSAGVIAVAMALAPLLCLGLVTAIGIERFSPRRLGGLVLGLGAVVLIAGPSGAGVPLGALLMAVGAACCYATEDVYIAVGRPPTSGAFTLLCGMLVAASLYLMPGWLLAGGGLPLPLTARAGWTALGIMALGNLLAYGGFVALVTRTGPVFASQVSYVVVAAGVLWGVAVLDEQHAAGFWLALALMLAGLTLARPEREKRA